MTFSELHEKKRGIIYMLSIWSRSFNKKTAVCGHVADFSEFMLLIRGSLSNSSTNVFNSHKVAL